MMKLLALGIVVSLLTPFPAAEAQELIVNDGIGESMISGTITEINADMMTVAIEDDTRVQVRIDEMDLKEKNMGAYFTEGMRVQVVGEFEDGEMDARQIMKLPE